jgi:hypothetical protein
LDYLDPEERVRLLAYPVLTVPDALSARWDFPAAFAVPAAELLAVPLAERVGCLAAYWEFAFRSREAGSHHAAGWWASVPWTAP